MATRVPTGEPLIGRFVRLDLLTEADLPELFPVLADPELYAGGYVMHEYAPAAVKLAAVGHGAADKETVTRGVVALLGLSARPSAKSSATEHS